MDIRDKYARMIFQMIFQPTNTNPQDFPIKDGKFEVDYSGVPLEVVVRRREKLRERNDVEIEEEQ